MSEDNRIRLSKKVASCTLLSRREASEVVKKGEITVNGTIEKDPSRVLEGNEEVLYKGELLSEKIQAEYYAFNKPKSMLFDGNSVKNRPSVKDILLKTTKAELLPIYPIPDAMCGLTVLTNDEVLLKKFESGTPVIKQFYEVFFANKITKVIAGKIQKKLSSTVEFRFKQTIWEDKEDGSICVIEMYGLGAEKLYPLLEKMGGVIQKMDRIYFGGITKKDISRGWFRKLTEQEIVLLKHFFNPSKPKKLGT